MYDVITVGSATVDAFTNTGKKLFKKGKKDYVQVPFGSKILIEQLKFDIGGGGTNTAVALSKLGLKISYIGSMGCGTNSQRIKTLLKKEKVDCSFIQSCNGRTGFSVILDAEGHDRTILVFKGNNDNLEFNQINKSKLKTKWFYFSAMLNKSLKTQIKLAEYAKKHHIKIAYNPSCYLAKKGTKLIKPILEKTTLLVLNREEAEYLVNGKNINQILKKLQKLGPEIAIVTDGYKPTYAIDNNHIYKIIPDNIKVLEATGAGDAFASSVLAGLIKKHDLEFALKLGLANSQSVITHYGAKNKLLTYKEAVKIAKHKKVKKVKL